jgi:hypothetical protein
MEHWLAETGMTSITSRCAGVGLLFFPPFDDAFGSVSTSRSLKSR